MTVQTSFTHVFGEALRGTPTHVTGIHPDDQVLPVGMWLQPASPSDAHLLAHCRGVTLDVGCGPGRMSAHLAERGHEVAGVDVVREAVEQTRRRGVVAVHRDVFGPMPGERRWDTVLLADGNIGIGGDPARLLRRATELLADGGRVVCDLAEPGTGLRVREASLVTRGLRSSVFRWAQVGPEAIGSLAASVGLGVRTVAEHRGRWYAVVAR